jgi:tetratricopeptide (TPR) repeat protein
MPKTAQSQFMTCLDQCKRLKKSANWQALQHSLPTALRLAQNLLHFQQLLDLLKPIKHHFSQTSQTAYADLLLCAREFTAAHSLLESLPQTPETLPLLALAKLRTGLPSAALGFAKRALEQNQRPEIAWRVIAEASFELGLEDWRGAFDHAIAATTHRQQGFVYIEYGRCLELWLDSAAARENWSKALEIFKGDTHYLAQVLGNLGLSCVREGRLEEAEGLYQRLQNLPKNPSTPNLEWQAWRGLGITRRAAGEYQRALYAYQQAQRCAGEPFEVIQALRGIGYTLRLSGNPSQALGYLQQALKLQKKHHLNTNLEPDLAAAQLADGNSEAARQTLEGWYGSGEDAGRAKIVQAELARLEQSPSLALEWVKDVNWHSLWGREELQAFPKLRSLLLGMDVALPEPFQPAPKQTTIQVRARGALQVWVNQRRMALKATSRAAQVLVLLLEHGGSRGLRELIEDLFPNVEQSQAKNKLKQVSKAVVELRQKFGWLGSVEENGGVYSLDPEAVWDYDVAQARDKGEVIQVFMSGVDADWVLERLRGFENQTRALN